MSAAGVDLVGLGLKGFAGFAWVYAAPYPPKHRKVDRAVHQKFNFMMGSGVRGPGIVKLGRAQKFNFMMGCGVRGPEIVKLEFFDFKKD